MRGPFFWFWFWFSKLFSGLFDFLSGLLLKIIWKVNVNAVVALYASIDGVMTMSDVDSMMISYMLIEMNPR